VQSNSGNDGGAPDRNKSANHPALTTYFSFMVKVAAGLVGKNKAEDVASVALWDACSSDRPKPPLDKPEEVKRYLRRLVWFRVLAHWKVRKNKWNREIPSSPDIENDDSVATFDICGMLINKIALEKGMNELRADQRELLHAYYFLGYTAKEIALQKNENESTIRSRIDRTVDELQEIMRSKYLLPGFLGLFAPFDYLSNGLAQIGHWMTNLGKTVGWVKAKAWTVAVLLAAPTLSVAAWVTHEQGSARMDTKVVDVPDSLPSWQPSLETMTLPNTAPVWSEPDPVRPEQLKPTKRASAPKPTPKELEKPAFVTVAWKEPRAPEARAFRRCNDALSQSVTAAKVGDSGRCLEILAENETSNDRCSDDDLARARSKCQPL